MAKIWSAWGVIADLWQNRANIPGGRMIFILMSAYLAFIVSWSVWAICQLC
jgi:hypothetical protein